MKLLGRSGVRSDFRALRVLSGLAGMPNIQRTGFFYVPLAEPYTSTDFDGDSFSTVGSSTLIDMSATFASLPDNTCHIRAYDVQLIVRDSAAWGSGSYHFDLGPSAAWYNALVARCYGSDLKNSHNGIVPASATGDLYYQCVASGAATLDVWLQLNGYFA